MPGWKRATALVCCAVVVSMASTAHTATATTRPSTAPVADSRTVTLITGDKVTVLGGQVRFTPAHPADGSYRREVINGDTYVIPTSAMRLLDAGRLDRQLFDITKLIQYGYDDAQRSTLPLIVESTGARPFAAAGKVGAALPSIGATAIAETKSDAGRVWNGMTGVRHVWLDAKVHAAVAQNVRQIGAPAAWREGYTGKGATVAVLDTGIDSTHPDLADAVTATKDFTGSVDGTQDAFGHGTHVASIITGNGAASDGKYVGVAPDTKLLVGKVLDDQGSGTESQILQGMQWAVAQHVRVVNMSLGAAFAGVGTDVLAQAVDQLTANSGTLFVVSAGNDGPMAQTIDTPGVASAALTVGAVDRSNRLADFSSRGPLTDGAGIKPDITAPGVNIVAARAAGSTLGAPIGTKYQMLSGTSMAAPHVAGAAAILAAEHPTWRAPQLKAALMDSAQPTARLNVDEQGAGRVDVAAAVNQGSYATPAVVNDGTAQWPHTDDTPIKKTVTYHNSGTKPLTLTIRPDVASPRGKPAPPNMFTASPSRVTIPAGKTAPVTVTTNTEFAGDDGLYGGTLVATGNHTSLRTPISVNKEVESYDVSVRPIGANGKPAQFFTADYTDLHQPTAYGASDESATTTIRVPKGTYNFEGSVSSPIGADFAETWFFEPAQKVTRSTTLTLDARKGKPVGATVDRAGAAVLGVSFESIRKTDWGDTGIIGLQNNFDNFLVVPSATRTAASRYSFTVGADWARPDGRGGFDHSPYLYHVQWAQPGRVPSTLVRKSRTKDLGYVISQQATPPTGLVAARNGLVTTDPPRPLTVYYSPGQPLTDVDLLESADKQTFYMVEASAPQTYRRGRNPSDKWDYGVIAPSWVNGPGNVWFGRQGDAIGGAIPLFTDSAPTHYLFGIADDTATTTLYRNGVTVRTDAGLGSNGFPVLPGAANYRLDVQAGQHFLTTSTKVSASWTFRSGHTNDLSPAALPLMAVRFDPNLAADNSAPANRALRLPIYVQRQAGAHYGNLRSLTLQVSYDDGKTWVDVPTNRHGDRASAMIHHPASATDVSIRAHARDSAGNAVTETIIRAYNLK